MSKENPEIKVTITLNSENELKVNSNVDLVGTARIITDVLSTMLDDVMPTEKESE